MLCEWCKIREAKTLVTFKKGIPSHVGAKLEATMNLCDECRAKIKAKALKFSSIVKLDKFLNNRKEAK